MLPLLFLFVIVVERVAHSLQHYLQLHSSSIALSFMGAQHKIYFVLRHLLPLLCSVPYPPSLLQLLPRLLNGSVNHELLYEISGFTWCILIIF